MAKVSIRGSIAANRFGLGARPGDLLAASQAEQEWLKGQLSTPLLDGSLPSSAEALRRVAAFQRSKKQQQKKSAKTPFQKTMIDMDMDALSLDQPALIKPYEA